MFGQRQRYQDYMQSPAWMTRRLARLEVAGHQCEYEPVTGQYKSEYIYGERCTATHGLHVHHLHYDTLGDEADNDLEVLCLKHHVVRHLMMKECDLECCEDEVVDDESWALDTADEVMAMCRDGYTMAEAIDSVTPTYCDYHEHMLTKDD